MLKAKNKTKLGDFKTPPRKHDPGSWILRPWALVSGAGVVSFLSVSPLAGANQAEAGQTETLASKQSSLLNLSLEELSNLRITSVSKREQKFSEAGAAISVVTGEDVRRQGALTLTDALRYVPGVHVGNVNSSSAAVSVRGFNDQFSNKLLVLVDGRSVYNPVFSGVIWETQDLLLEDLDRIEVIRGPGATLWGANAVNGVINILTKPAKDTQGLLMSGGGGLENRGFGAIRYGAKLGETHFRVYAKHSEVDGSALANGNPAYDAWRRSQGGFRLDWNPSESSELTFQGDVYHTHAEHAYAQPLVTAPYSEAIYTKDRFLGANFLTKWDRQFSEQSRITSQIYYDRTDSALLGARELRDTLDWDVQHHWDIGERHSLVYGGGYRYSNSRLHESPSTQFRHDSTGINLFNVFAQDEIDILPDHLKLSIGSKLENNDYTGIEIQPSARLTWLPNERNTLWTSVSRAIRSPSQMEIDVMVNRGVIPAGQSMGGYVNPFLPTLLRVNGTDGFKSEELMAYELGYRVQLSDPISLDLATFYNEYDRLRSSEFDFSKITTEGSPFPSNAVLPIFLRNGFWGETYGSEMSVTWRVQDSWRLVGSYEFMQMQLHKGASTLDFTEQNQEVSAPHHQVKIRGMIGLSQTVELDLGIRYVDSISQTVAPSYVVADARIGWSPSPHWELSLVGQNLFERRHAEFSSQLGTLNQGQIQTAFFAKITARF